MPTFICIIILLFINYLKVEFCIVKVLKSSVAACWSNLSVILARDCTGLNWTFLSSQKLFYCFKLWFCWWTLKNCLPHVCGLYDGVSGTVHKPKNENFILLNHENKQVMYSLIIKEPTFIPEKCVWRKQIHERLKPKLHIANCIRKSLLIDDSNHLKDSHLKIMLNRVMKS